MGLSTHVLDTTNGVPARGVEITLLHEGAAWFEGVTNEDGRCPGLLGDRALEVGHYSLIFAVADYFRSKGHVLPDPPFIDRVTIDFAVANAESHYHVPLLVSPFGYSTYRGS
jgi:5-hydroxyisourate hydrolase